MANSEGPDKTAPKPRISTIRACPCDLYPLALHFYIVSLGFTGVYIIFLFLL